MTRAGTGFLLKRNYFNMNWPIKPQINSHVIQPSNGIACLKLRR